MDYSFKKICNHNICIYILFYSHSKKRNHNFNKINNKKLKNKIINNIKDRKD